MVLVTCVRIMSVHWWQRMIMEDGIVHHVLYKKV